MILRSEKEEANAIADAIGLTDEELKRVKNHGPWNLSSDRK